MIDFSLILLRQRDHPFPMFASLRIFALYRTESTPAVFPHAPAQLQFSHSLPVRGVHGKYPTPLSNGHSLFSIFLTVWYPDFSLQYQYSYSPLPPHRRVHNMCMKMALVRKFSFIERKLKDRIYHLKVPKCEIFHLFDFNDFYGIKSVQVGDLRAKIKN